MKFICTAVSVMLVLAAACAGPTAFYVRNAEISVDSGVRPIGAQSVSEPQSGSYYFFFHGANLTMIDHFYKVATDQPRQRLLYIEAGLDGRLLRTVKNEELFRDTYGALFAGKTCFYGRPVQEYHSTVSISASDSKVDHELPAVLPSMPHDAPQLTALTLIRIYRDESGYIAICANYEANGRLGSLDVSHSTNGEFMSIGTWRIDLTKPDPRLNQYGIAAQIDPVQFTRLRRLRLPPVDKPEIVSLVYRHYGFGSLFEKDVLTGGVVTSSQVLRPLTPKEESTLDAVCNSSLSQQQAMGMSTVF